MGFERETRLGERQIKKKKIKNCQPNKRITHSGDSFVRFISTHFSYGRKITMEMRVESMNLLFVLFASNYTIVKLLL